MSLSKLQEIVKDREAWHAEVLGVSKESDMTEQQNNKIQHPWTARRSNQSILKKINLEYSLEGLMLKIKLQYFGHLIQRANSLGKKP